MQETSDASFGCTLFLYFLSKNLKIKSLNYLIFIKRFYSNFEATLHSHMKSIIFATRLKVGSCCSLNLTSTLVENDGNNKIIIREEPLFDRMVKIMSYGWKIGAR